MADSNSPRHVVVTGAAGALGRAVAQHFLDEGARLALVDHSQERLSEAFPGLDNSRHLLLQADVRSADGMRAAHAQILDTLSQVDVLVHVAGGFEMGETVDTLSREAWERMLELNAWSFVAVTQPLVARMRARRSGKVVAVTAQSAARGAAGVSAYIASKSALQRLVESMAAEVKAEGINVNSVAPTILDTPANRQAMPDADPTQWVSTAVAAQTIGFLASPAAVALHGQHLVLG